MYTLCLFYNNCNCLEINTAVGTFFAQTWNKTKHKYIKDIESPTEIDNIIRKTKQWEINIACLVEVCVEWANIVPKRVVEALTKNTSPMLAGQCPVLN